MAVTATQSSLAGLPRRLVQDGIISEEKLQEATEAARKERLPLIAYLVAEELEGARDLRAPGERQGGDRQEQQDERESHDRRPLRAAFRASRQRLAPSASARCEVREYAIDIGQAIRESLRRAPCTP